MSARYRRHPAVETAPLQQETILYHPGPNRFCLLNTTAAFLWEHLAEPRTEADLSAALLARFAGVDKATAERDVRQALEELRALAVVEAEP